MGRVLINIMLQMIYLYQTYKIPWACSADWNACAESNSQNSMSSADSRQEKAEKAKWFKFTRHGLLVDHSSFTLDHKPGLRSKQISAKVFPWACITPEGKVSKPSPLHNFPVPLYFSGWPRVPWLLVFQWRRPPSALEEVKSNPAVRGSSERQETIEQRLKIHLIFSLHVHWISIVIRGIKCF